MSMRLSGARQLNILALRLGNHNRMLSNVAKQPGTAMPPMLLFAWLRRHMMLADASVTAFSRHIRRNYSILKARLS